MFVVVTVRTPFRLSFLGGGTDLPAFYLQEEGMVLSTTINKYMYVTVKDRFEPNFRISYSRTEICDHVDKIEHQIVRAILKRHAPNRNGLEVVSMSDIPAGTGLGSSSSFAVSMIHALRAHLGSFEAPEFLAQEAAIIELEDLAEPIGKQDQYAAAFGGLRTIHFYPDNHVEVRPVDCSVEKSAELESHVMMFYTGIQRSASGIFEEQKKNTPQKMKELREARDLAMQLKVILEKNRSIKEFGKILGQGWEIKRSMATGVTTHEIDTWYQRGIQAGAYGGKILGAGGGGFLMFICPPEKQMGLRAALSELRFVPMKFESWGSKIISVGEG